MNRRGIERTCKFCHESGGDDFIAPCNCSGSVRWVHRSCLDSWRTMSTNSNSFYQCEVCKAEYQFEVLHKSWRFYYAMYILRDVLCLLALFQLLIGLCWVVLSIVSSIERRREYFPKHWSEIAVNYAAAATMFFFFMGIYGAIRAVMYLCLDAKTTVPTHATIDSQDLVNVGAPFWFFNVSYTDIHSRRAQSRDPNHNPNHLDCPRCNGCNTCDCNCGGSNDACAICVIIFAIIGVIFSLCLFIYYLCLIIQVHLHILYRKSQTHEYYVIDLSKNITL